MSEVKNPMIKLFGKTISFPAKKVVDFDHHDEERKQDMCSTVLDNKGATRGDLIGSKLEVDIVKKIEDESVEPETPSRNSETPKPPAADPETLSPNVTKTEEQSETSGSKEITLKKPDKILPCARCNSMDTKFCYYNNNNVNQPRHFCRSCQRYWTAGGTMRNVPVGSGRRKNKSICASSYSHMTVSEASHPLEADGTVFAFSSERPLSESMASVLHLAGRAHAFIPNGFQGNETRLPISYGETKTRIDHLNGPCCMSLELSRKQGQDNSSSLHQEPVLRMPYFSETTLHSHLNAALYSSSASQHAFSPSGFPVTFYPAIQLCGFTGPSPWNVQYPSASSPSSNQLGISTNPLSPLGKRHRNGSMLTSNSSKNTLIKENDEPSHVMLPKALKIHDVNDTPKSFTRSPMRIKNGSKDSCNGESLFNAFYTKDVNKNHIVDTSLVLQANPAAFSRSVNFHETA